MSKARSFAKRAATKCFSALPAGALEAIERSASLAQGKGWGDGTVDAEVRAALSLLQPNDLDGLVAVDIGANVGTWTAALLTRVLDAKVYAFEPSTASFASLQDRFGADSRVQMFKAAVSNRTGMAQLWSDAPGSSLGSLSKRRLDHFNVSFDQVEDVSLLTLDSWRDEVGCSPTLIKMDVEGHELEVLEGATELLRSVKVIQFEFGGCNIDTRTYLQDFYYFFEAIGFVLYRLGPKGLHRLTRYTERDESFSTTNFFAAPSR